MIADFPADLLQFLQSENARAFDTSLIEKRKIANEFYRGEPFGDEVDGRSQLVTRDVAEVVDYMTVAIMRTMVSDKVVEFEARTADQQEAARDATELVAWQFMRQQSGVTIIRDCLVSGLLEKTGVLKTWVEPTEEVVDDVVPVTVLDDDETIIAAEPTEEYDVDPNSGEVVQLYAVRRKVEGQPKFRDAAVPNEEFGFSPDARSLDEADYIVHRTRHTVLAVMAMFGLTEEDARTLSGSYGEGQTLSDARDSDRAHKDSDDSAIGLTRKVWVEEEYVRWDYNGDGHGERLKVHRVGTKVLAVSMIDEQPFVIWSPFPSPHRIVGLSLADKTMDIQRVRSMLLRQAMDALYFANAPRSLIDTASLDENTIDDMLSIVPGAPIRYRGTPPTPWQMPFAAPHAFTALEFMSGERESRTGITRHNQGMNPDTLNKTASGMAMLAQQGAQMEEYVARNFAECLAELFEKKLRLMRKFGLVAQVRVGGEFRDVDASTLDGEMDIGIRVGLGTGRKDQRIAYRMQILEMQKQAKDVGSPLVDDSKLFASADGIVADMGLGDGNQFFNDPRTQPPHQEPQKDPATIEVEGKLQLEQQRQQFEQQKAGAALEIDRMRAEAQAEIAREKALLDAQLMQDKAALEADLAERKFQFEQQLAERRMLADLAMRDTQGMPQNRPGGDLDK